MLNLTKPPKLNIGDKVAIVSLSSGSAGEPEIRWRYEQGKERLRTVFGLEPIEMPHTLHGNDYIYNNPQARAADLMQAFADTEIKAVISTIGGEDSIRMLPYIDYDVIKSNPKIFMGYSDTTITHYICLKAGLSSFYGAAVLTDFAENISMTDYTVEWINRILFSAEVIGNIPTSPTWSSQYLRWIIENKNTARDFIPNRGYELIQGSGKVAGRLIGGCIEVMEFIKGTELFPSLDAFNNAIMFLETSEEKPNPSYIRYWLRNYGAMGVFERINGMIFAKPMDETFYNEYKVEIIKILREYGREDMPVLYNANFGHFEPKMCVPYGALAEFDCDNIMFSILESGVV